MEEKLRADRARYVAQYEALKKNIDSLNVLSIKVMGAIECIDLLLKEIQNVNDVSPIEATPSG